MMTIDIGYRREIFFGHTSHDFRKCSFSLSLATTDVFIYGERKRSGKRMLERRLPRRIHGISIEFVAPDSIAVCIRDTLDRGPLIQLNLTSPLRADRASVLVSLSRKLRSQRFIVKPITTGVCRLY